MEKGWNRSQGEAWHGLAWLGEARILKTIKNHKGGRHERNSLFRKGGVRRCYIIINAQD